MNINPYKLPVEGFDADATALSEARQAAVEANAGLRHREQYVFHEAILRRWSELMVSAPIAIHNVIFAVAMIVDAIVSWEIVRVVVAENQIAQNPWMERAAVLSICLVINLWAAVTAHFWGKGWSKEVQDWERWNFFYIKNQQAFREKSVEPTMRREIWRARWLALFSAATLLTVVGTMIWFRNQILGSLIEDASVSAMNWVMTVLPLAIVLCEFVTGDYVWYTLRRWQRKRKRNAHRTAFLTHKAACGELDQDVFAHMNARKWTSESPQASGDMARSYARARFRSQDKDDYLDPTETLKKVSFCFRYRGSGGAVARVKVFGTLANGAKTGDQFTDETGRATISLGDYEKLETVWVDDFREVAGPFQAGAEHFIDVASLAEALGGQNGTAIAPLAES